IDDLLAFSRHGRAELRRVNVHLNDIVEDARKRVEDEAAGRNIQWEIGTLPAVWGDAGLLQQVFVNLLSNAVKYTRGKDVARIEIGARPNQGNNAVVYVRDNGAGFDMKYVDKLFGVFQRLHSAH